MDGRTRLAKAFGDWIELNGWTQTEVVAMGGPSTTTQTKVTKTDEPISRQTLKQIDLVMGWPAGTSAGVLDDPDRALHPRGHNPARLAAQELGLSVTAMMQRALRLATDPEVQAEAPEQCAAIIRRRNAARVSRSAAPLGR